MDYSKYFERVQKGEKAENEFQYPGPDDLPAWSDWLFHNLYVSFTGLIDHSDTKAGDIVNFLDYHFKRYNGDPAQFILCIRTIKATCKKMIDKGPPINRNWLYQYDLYTPIIDKWITKAEKKPQKGKYTDNPKKGSISVIRARAFCIALIQESGRGDFIKGNALRRNDIMEFAKETWGKNGRTVYNECLNIISEKNPINKWYKEDNPKEYELGLKLYKEIFPD